MSLYFAHPANDHTKQVVSQAVKDRGLSFLRAKPCDVQVSVLTIAVQPGHACYSRNLPAFMLATSTQKRVFIGNHGFPLKKVPFAVSMRMPPLIYDFDVNPNDRLEEELLKHSEKVEGRGKKSTFIMREPTQENIKTVVDVHKANTKTIHIVGTVNVDALKTVLVIRKVLSMFLLTHTYAAFRHSSDINPAKDDMFASTTKKRKLDDASYELCVTEPQKYVGEPAAGEAMNVDNEPMTHDIELKYAKPSHVTTKTWGPADEVPNSDGLFIPFVKELAVKDTITVPTLFSDYFLRSLASSTKVAFEKMDELRAGWGVISDTNLGHEISHLCKCIDIAMKAQATLYPIYTHGIYEGTVICGAGYTVSVHGKVYTPLPYGDLQKLVSDKSAHSYALSKIVKLCEDKQTEIIACTSMRQLSKLLLECTFDELNKQEVIRLAHQLSYSTRYWSTSIANIHRALSFLPNPELEIPNDVPMHPKFVFSMDRVEQVMSAFGHQAPTFMIPGGKKCAFSDKDPPKNFHVRTISVEAAVTDMKYLVEHGYITNNLNNLSKGYKDTSINGPNKVNVWKALGDLWKLGKSGPTESDTKQAPEGSVEEIDDDIFGDLEDVNDE